MDSAKSPPQPAPASVLGATARLLGGPRQLGTYALGALVGCMFLLAASAAAKRSPIVARSSVRFPNWVAGPLHGLGFETSNAVRVVLVVSICIAYTAVLVCAQQIGARRLLIGIALALLAALLAPPLLSSDVFGYIGFARLGALHGLSPYVFTASSAPHDPVFPFLGWHPPVTTPYGPLFTLFTYALVPLGLAGALWALKILAALTTLATVAILWRTAERVGVPPIRTAAIYGLNPLVLIFAVGGAHNETLFGVLLAAGALWIFSARERAAGAALICATAIKLSAGLILPFALLGANRRRRIFEAMLATLAVVAVAALAAFGPHIANIFGALFSEQQDVAGHSIPAELSRLLGFPQRNPQTPNIPLGVRVGFLVGFAVTFLAMLWRTWRGAPWLDAYAWTTLALLGSTAWLLPWYGLWALLPASLSASRRLRVVTLLACAYLMLTRLAVGAPLSAG